MQWYGVCDDGRCYLTMITSHSSQHTGRAASQAAVQTNRLFGKPLQRPSSELQPLKQRKKEQSFYLHHHTYVLSERDKKKKRASEKNVFDRCCMQINRNRTMQNTQKGNFPGVLSRYAPEPVHGACAHTS